MQETTFTVYGKRRACHRTTVHLAGPIHHTLVHCPFNPATGSPPSGRFSPDLIHGNHGFTISASAPQSLRQASTLGCSCSGKSDHPPQEGSQARVLPLSHEASSDPSPQLSFPSHFWLSGRHFPLEHLKFPAGQPVETPFLSNAQHALTHWAPGSQSSAPPHPKVLTASLLVTAVPAVVDTVTDPEEGLAELVLARELVGGIASCGGRARISCRLPGAARAVPVARLLSYLESSELLCAASCRG